VAWVILCGLCGSIFYQKATPSKRFLLYWNQLKTSMSLLALHGLKLAAYSQKKL